MPTASRSIPKHTCQHSLFPGFVQDYVDAVRLLWLPSMLAWATYEVVLPVAADAVLRRVLAAPYSGSVPELTALTCMARAVSRCEVRMA